MKSAAMIETKDHAKQPIQLLYTVSNNLMTTEAAWIVIDTLNIPIIRSLRLYPLEGCYLGQSENSLPVPARLKPEQLPETDRVFWLR